MPIPFPEGFGMWTLDCPNGYGLACPFCIENLKGRASHRGHKAFRESRRKEIPFMARFVKPSSAPVQADGGGPEVDPSDIMAYYPALLEFLTLTRWDEGGARETGTLTVFLGQGGLQASLNDRDSGMVAFVTASSFTGLLKALEGGLVDGSLGWRQAKTGKGSRKHA